MVVPSQTSSMDSTEQAEAKKTRLRSSKVWGHFTQRLNNMVPCKLGKLEMAYHSSTTAMLEHLRHSSMVVVLWQYCCC